MKKESKGISTEDFPGVKYLERNKKADFICLIIHYYGTPHSHIKPWVPMNDIWPLYAAYNRTIAKKKTRQIQVQRKPTPIHQSSSHKWWGTVWLMAPTWVHTTQTRYNRGIDDIKQIFMVITIASHFSLNIPPLPNQKTPQTLSLACTNTHQE